MAIIPLYDDLRCILARIPKHSTAVLTNARRRPWTANGFGTGFNRAKIKAGLNDRANPAFSRFAGDSPSPSFTWLACQRVIAEIMALEEESVAKIIRRYVDRAAATKALIRQINERRT